MRVDGGRALRTSNTANKLDMHRCVHSHEKSTTEESKPHLNRSGMKCSMPLAVSSSTSCEMWMVVQTMESSFAPCLHCAKANSPERQKVTPRRLAGVVRSRLFQYCAAPAEVLARQMPTAKMSWLARHSNRVGLVTLSFMAMCTPDPSSFSRSSERAPSSSQRVCRVVRPSGQLNHRRRFGSPFIPPSTLLAKQYPFESRNVDILIPVEHKASIQNSQPDQKATPKGMFPPHTGKSRSSWRAYISAIASRRPPKNKNTMITAQILQTTYPDSKH